ncbi:MULTISPECIES: TioE family transcriptional regulator [Bacillus]|uniref:TioE family transcriptional regulator n=1 Tax=Bacillus TaxID=1386 RepID=UPI00047C679D|nr:MULTISPECIES: TioE family transcriptional regulator [Bacillus]QHZ48867.1 MerR family DNA-binding transcriptional regulator [Bacillus sp. NSP9.1]WFA05496.1 TioE family transcriptional regulator [Bacillus sp. HSf4]
MRYYKPIEIARELNISTSALRHYESWGVVPKPARDVNGYRLYTKVHFAYFRCLRTMFAGFGVGVTCEVLRSIQNAEMDKAFWLVNKEQANLQQEKNSADQTLALIENLELPTDETNIKQMMTIGEAADFTKVNASAIRHWEKEGLLTPKRDPENGYRLFTPLHIRKILLISTLRKTVYFLKHMEEFVEAIENQSLEQVKKVLEKALSSINKRNREQLRGVHQLIELCNVLDLM